MPHLRSAAEGYPLVNDRGGVYVVLLFDHQNSSIGRLTGSPLVTSERWAAWRTLSTRNPLLPSVKGWMRDSIELINAWHSRLRGSSSVNATSTPLPLTGIGSPLSTFTCWS